MKEDVAVSIKKLSIELALIATKQNDPRVAVTALAFAFASVASAHGIDRELFKTISDRASETVYKTAAELNIV
jgi:hypothetical protein